VCYSSKQALLYEQVTESKLAKFVEDFIVPPKMIHVIVDGEVSFQIPSFYVIVALVGFLFLI